MARDEDEDLDFDLDDGLDFPDLEGFDGPSQNPKDGPIKKIALSFAEGAKERIRSPAFIAKLARESLPKGYGTAMDFASKVAGGAGELYDVAATELKPATAAMRKMTKAALPKAKSLLPEKVLKKLEEFAEKDEDGKAGQSEEDILSEKISSDLTELFQTQMENQAETEEKNKIEQLARDKLTTKRYQDQRALLATIGRGVDRVASYNERVTVRYQRKNLELQYRQLYTQTELLKSVKENGLRNSELLDAVMKNTAMSEQEKLQFSHRAKGALKDRIIGGFQNKSQEFFKNYGENLMKSLKDKVRSGVGAFSDAVMGVNDAYEMTGMGEDMGKSRGELLGSSLGGGFVDFLGKKVGNIIRKRISPDGKIGQTGGFLSRFLGDLGGSVNTLLKKEKGKQREGLFGGFLDFLLDPLPTHSFSGTLKHRGLLDGDEPAQFDNLVHRSITEIIPTWLGEIHAELRRSRTGNNDFQPLKFNLDSGQLTTKTKIHQDIKKYVFNEDNVGRFRESNDKVIDSLVAGQGISKQGRDALDKMLLKMYNDGEALDFSKFNVDAMKDIPDPKVRREIAQLIQGNFYKDGKLDENKANPTAALYKRARENTPDPVNALDGLISQYGIRTLEETGLVRKTKDGYELNQEAYARGLFSEAKGVKPKEEKTKDKSYVERVGEKANGFIDDVLENLVDKVIGAAEKNETIQSGLKGAKRRAKKARLKGQRAAQSLREKLDSVSARAEELSTGAELDGLLDQTALDNGEYKDAKTGETILDASEITGAVVDSDGNEVVDAKTGRLLGARAKRLSSVDAIASKTKSNYRDVKNRLSKAAKKAMASKAVTDAKAKAEELLAKTKATKVGDRTVSEIAEGTIASAKATIDKVQSSTSKSARRANKKLAKQNQRYDRIIGKLDNESLKAGHYQDTNGNVIYSPADIHGAILDSEGKQVITEAEGKFIGQQHASGAVQARESERTESVKAKAKQKAKETLDVVAEKAQQIRAGMAGKVADVRASNARVDAVLTGTEGAIASARSRVSSARDSVMKTRTGAAAANAFNALKAKSPEGKRSLKDTLNVLKRSAGDLVNAAKGDTLSKLEEILGERITDDQGNLIYSSQELMEKANKVSQAHGEETLNRLKAKGNQYRDAVSAAANNLKQKTNATIGKYTTGGFAGSDVLPAVKPVGMPARKWKKILKEQAERQAAAEAEATTEQPQSRFARFGNYVKDRYQDIRNAAEEQLKVIRQKYDDLRQKQKDAKDRLDSASTETERSESTNELLEVNKQQLEVLQQILEAFLSKEVVNVGPRRLFHHTRKGIAGLWKGAKTLGSGYLSYVKNLGKTSWNLTKGIARGARDILTGGREFFSDIYVEGQSNPVLYAKKMRNGDYKDAKSGKTIKSIKDIKGPVMNELGEVVLTAEEYASGLYHTRKGKLIKWGFGLLGSVGKAVLGGYATLFKLPFQAIKKTGDLIGKVFKPKIADVYVKGESTPRLLAFKMRNGEYWRVKDGKPVKTVEDLEGEIKNREGNTVLSDEDYDKGIVNSWGVPFKYLSNKLKGLAVKAVGGALNLVGTVAKGATKVVGGMLKFGYGAMSRVLNWGGGILKPKTPGFLKKLFGKKNDPHLEALEKIYGVLNDRLPMQKKKPKKGSWQEKFETKEAEDAKKKDEAAADAKSNKFGIGALLNFFKSPKGIFAKLFGGGGDGDEDDDDGDGGGGSTFIDASGGGKDKDGKKPRRSVEQRRKDRTKRLKHAARRRGKLGALFRAKDAIGGALGRGKGKVAGWFGRGNGARAATAAAGAAASKPGMLSRAGGILSKGKGLIGGPGKIALGIGAMLGGSYLADKVLGKDTEARKMAGTAANVAGWGMTASAVSGMLGGPTLGTLAGGALSAGGAALGGVGTALGGVGAAALGTIGLPVVAVGAVIAGAGYLGYKAFKKYKYGSYIPLRAYRVAQYGYKFSDSSKVEKIADLEDMCMKALKEKGGGLDLVPTEEVTMEKIIELFGVDEGWFSKRTKERESFALWFNNRFKPIFLHWMTNLRVIDPKMHIADADDKLSQEQKKQLLEAANKVSPTVYSINSGAFDGDPVEMSIDKIEDEYKLALDKVEKDKTTTGKVTSKLDRITDAMSMTNPILYFANKHLKEKKRAKELADINAKQMSEVGKAANSVEQAKLDGEQKVNAAAAAAVSATAAQSAKIDEEAKKASGGFLGGARGFLSKAMAFTGVGVAYNLMQKAGFDPLASAKEFLGGKLPEGASSAKARGAAAYATTKAGPKSLGLCAKFVANALEAAGYKFQRQPSAYMYDTNGILQGMGFTRMPEGTPPQAGDVMVIAASAKHKHGHIQIFNGTNWISDFVQRSDSPYRERYPSSLWRDMSQSIGERISNGLNAAKQQFQAGVDQISQGNYMAGAGLIGTTGFANASGMMGNRANYGSVTAGDGKAIEQAVIAEAKAAGITNPMELASLLGQTAVESGNFTRFNENLNYSAQGLMKTWPKRFPTLAQAQAVVAGGQPAIAESVYGGRMGNVNPGDAFKYRGRGPIQLTGRANYEAFAKASGINVVDNPDLLTTDPTVAAKAAVWYWTTRVRGKADPTNVEAVTKLVNGGTNHLRERMIATSAYARKLAGEGLSSSSSQASPMAPLAAAGTFGVMAATGAALTTASQTGGNTTTTANGPSFTGVSATVSTSTTARDSVKDTAAPYVPMAAAGAALATPFSPMSAAFNSGAPAPVVPVAPMSGTPTANTPVATAASTADLNARQRESVDQSSTVNLAGLMSELVKLSNEQLSALLSSNSYLKQLVELAMSKTTESNPNSVTKSSAFKRPIEANRTNLPIQVRHS